jgi:membrane protease YdiL (CAAX protease family)
MYIIRREKPITENVRTVEIKVTPHALKDALPLGAPVLAAIIISASLSACVMTLFGYEKAITITESFPIAIILHALLPALLEELLFRYVPIKMLLPYSERAAVILSSVYFSLIHANLFQIPYAFIAGILFALIDIRAQSVIPSILIHFTNNTLSLIIIFTNGEILPSVIVYSAVAVAALISLLVIYIKRKSYKNIAQAIFNKGEAEEYSPAPVLLVITALTLALTSLF